MNEKPSTSKRRNPIHILWYHFFSLEHDIEKARRKEPPPDLSLPPDLPDLRYTLRTRKLAIALFWLFVLLDSWATPIGLYFGLFFGTRLSHNAVFSITTAAIGGASIMEYVLRFWALWRRDSRCRCIGMVHQRWFFDFFHWNYSFAWFLVMIELIVGTIFREPPIRLLSMPLTTMLYIFSVELIFVDTLRLLNIPSPFHISSVPKGAPMRPGVYFFIEDVIAVDGGGGTVYRERLNARYEASHLFRQMLHRLSFFWAAGGFGLAVALTVVIFTVPGPVAFAIGWTVPFVWGAIWSAITIRWVQIDLADEKRKWHGPVDEKEGNDEQQRTETV